MYLHKEGEEGAEAALVAVVPAEVASAEVAEVLEEATDRQRSEVRILVQDDLLLEGVRLVEEMLEEDPLDAEI